MTTTKTPPKEIIDAATAVGAWFAENNTTHWALGPCASRVQHDFMLKILRDIANNPDISSSSLAGIAAKAVAEVTGESISTIMREDGLQVIKLSGNMHEIPLNASGKAVDRTQLLKDTLTTAVEGGIAYWCAAKSIERDKDHLVLKVVGPFDSEDPTTKWEDITLDVVKRGFERLLDGSVKVNTSTFQTIAADWNDPESCAMDAEGADCVVQAGLLNEIVYG